MLPPSKWDLDRLRAVIEQLKLDALWSGRYHAPFTAEEDGVPEDGPIGAAFDAANIVLGGKR